jgi:uncharacterized protein
MSDAIEVTTATNRHITLAYEKEYAEWFGRMLNTINQFPGYRGVTSVVPGGRNPDARIVLYRFADKASMDNWENSPERISLVSEVERYASQSFAKASGLETWFDLPDKHFVVPPPKWKMGLVIFLAASIISFCSKLILGPYVSQWSLAETSLL